MNKYAFEHDELGTFLVEAENEARAIEVFAEKVRGKYGFDDATLEDFKDDIEQGNICISPLIVL